MPITVNSPPSAAPASSSPAAGADVLVRAAVPEDDAWVEHLQALAFGPGRFAKAAFRVRERFPIDKSLSLIAEIDGARVSSVWMTPISLTGVDGYLLGPLATDPAYRNRGAGKKLVREVTRMALERGETEFVLLVGDPPYYGPLGFVPTRLGAITFPAPVDPARVLVHALDPALALRLAGPIAAFGARDEGSGADWTESTGKSSA
jgi:predicted N-acetyltransferase YhbS